MIIEPLLSAALRHWGARTVPFSDSPEDTPFLTPVWEQTLRLLQQTAALRSLLLLSGDNGVGKSALVAHWLSKLQPKSYLPLVITQATLSGGGLLALLLRKLGKSASLLRSRNVAGLEAAFQEAGRLTPVLVLDEAQHYPPGALEEIRLLLGLNLCRQPALALVLIGDLFLEDTLRLQHHRPLYSRIAARCQLPPLEPSHIEPYLCHGFRQAGLDRPVLAPAALDLLAGASRGLPRLLNLLARAAWIAAAQTQANLIGPEHVRTALELVPAAAEALRS